MSPVLPECLPQPVVRAVAVAAAGVRETARLVGVAVHPSEADRVLRESVSSVSWKEVNGYLRYSVEWSPAAVYCCPARLA